MVAMALPINWLASCPVLTLDRWRSRAGWGLWLDLGFSRHRSGRAWRRRSEIRAFHTRLIDGQKVQKRVGILLACIGRRGDRRPEELFRYGRRNGGMLVDGMVDDPGGDVRRDHQGRHSHT